MFFNYILNRWKEKLDVYILSTISRRGDVEIPTKSRAYVVIKSAIVNDDNRYMEVDIWRWRYGGGDMEVEIWRWIYGGGDMEVDIWSGYM